jgi:hypothetical protein
MDSPRRRAIVLRMLVSGSSWKSPSRGMAGALGAAAARGAAAPAAAAASMSRLIMRPFGPEPCTLRSSAHAPASRARAGRARVGRVRRARRERRVRPAAGEERQRRARRAAARDAAGAAARRRRAVPPAARGAARAPRRAPAHERVDVLVAAAMTPTSVPTGGSPSAIRRLRRTPVARARRAP